jgi:hypothetical protein
MDELRTTFPVRTILVLGLILKVHPPKDYQRSWLEPVSSIYQVTVLRFNWVLVYTRRFPQRKSNLHGEGSAVDDIDVGQEGGLSVAYLH